MTDRNFNEIADRFESKLYGHWRGQIRLQLVTEGILEDTRCLQQNKTLRILDAGCGLGQMTLLLAQRGHHVTACDISSVMVERARARIEEANPDLMAHVDLHCLPLQELATQLLPTEPKEQFDLIVVHAVLEWLEDPRGSLERLLPLLKSGGELSLLFYNRHSIIFKNLLRADFRRIDEQDFKGDAGGLTPINPLLPEDMLHWLEQNSLTVETQRGIRTFYDYMEQNLDRNKPPKASFDEIMRKEKIFSTVEPYRGLARYLLWHCRKT